jgi:hypothetical protein
MTADADLKAMNRFDPDDYGRKCRVVEVSENKHQLQIRSKNDYIHLSQAPFHDPQEAIRWANQAYSLGQHEDV